MGSVASALPAVSLAAAGLAGGATTAQAEETMKLIDEAQTGGASPASGDKILRQLLADYRGAVETYDAARVRYWKVHRIVEAAAPPCPEGILPGHHFDGPEVTALRRQHNADELYDAMLAASNRVTHIVETMLATEAEGPSGIAAKLEAIPPSWDLSGEFPVAQRAENDWQDLFESVQSDVRRLAA